jgi:hypothetical protein
MQGLLAMASEQKNHLHLQYGMLDLAFKSSAVLVRGRLLYHWLLLQSQRSKSSTDEAKSTVTPLMPRVVL